MQRSTNNRTALTRAHLIVTAVGGPRILVEIPGSWHHRMVAATLYKLAAEIETDSEDQRWCVVTQRDSDTRGHVRLELTECSACNGYDRLPDQPSLPCRYCGGNSARTEERALDLLNRLAARYNTGKV